MADLSFTVTALDRAAATFLKLAAQVERLSDKLDKLDGKVAKVRAEAETKAAEAGLDNVERKVKSIDGKKATVKVDVHKSVTDTLARIGAVGAGLRAIALPTAILAASPQIASLGAAAVTATGALGVLPAVMLAGGTAAATMAVGFAHVNDALGPTGTTAQIKKVNEAMALLPPNAKATVTAIRALGPAWSSVRTDVQQKLFAGMAGQVRDLGARWLPVLRGALGGVASELNAGATGLMGWARSTPVLRDFNGIFGNIRAAIDRFLPSIQNILHVFVDLGAVGSEFLPKLAGGFTTATAHLEAFVAKARESGQLRQWIADGLTAVKDLGATVGNVGSILMSVFHAAAVSGGSLTATLRDVTGQVAAVLKSAKGQEALVAFFTGIRSVVSGLGPVVVALVPTVVALAHSLQSVLAAAVAAVVPVVQALAPLLTGLATAAGPVLTTVINALAAPLLTVASAITNALLPVLPPVGDALSQIALAVAPAITQLTVLAPVFGAVARAGAALLQFLAPFLSTMSSTFAGALSMIVPLITSAADGLTALLHVLTPIAPLLGFVAAAFVSFKMAASGVSTVQGILAKVSTAISDAALNAGTMTEKLTGSANAGEKVASAGGKVSGALSKVGSALPLIGIGLVGITAAYEVFGSKADEAAGKVLNGTVSMQAAIAAEAAQIHSNQIEWLGGMNAQESYAAAAKNVAAEIDSQRAAMTPMQRLQSDVARAQADLNDAVAQFGPKSQEAQSAAAALGGANDRLKGVTQGASDAEKTLGDRVSETQQIMAGAASADVGYQQALLTLEGAHQRAADAVAKYGAKSTEAKQANLDLTQASLAAADAAARKAEADAVASGSADVAAVKAQAYKEELLRQAETMSGPAKQALIDLANGTGAAGQAADTAKLQSQFYKDELQRLADQANGPIKAALETAKQKFDEIGNSHDTARNKADAQRGMLVQLALQASGPTRDAIQKMIDEIDKIHDKSFSVTGTGSYHIDSAGGVSGPGTATGGILAVRGDRVVDVQRYARGGVVPGYTPGRDVHRFRSATGGTLDLSGGEAVMRPEWTAAVGPGYVHGANAAARSGGVSGVRQYMGFASGGIILNGQQPFASIPQKLDSGVTNSLIHGMVPLIVAKIQALIAAATAAAARAFGGGGGSITAGGGRGFIIAHESGGNPTAQNPTSTASGLYQMINGTWRAYGGSTPTAKQASVAEQNAVADRYVLARYGSWDNAANFWRSHHWYDQGGYLMPGTTMAVNNTGQPERVLNPAQTRVHDQVTAAVAGGRAQGGDGGALLAVLQHVAGELHALRGDVDHHGDQAGINARLDVTNRLLAMAGRGSVAGAAEGNRTAGELGPW